MSTSKAAALTTTFLLLLLAGCAPDPQIHGAYAISTDDSNPLGGDVRPDQFKIHALVSSRAPMNVNDEFTASLNVGVLGEAAKYGGSGGIKYAITAPYAGGVAPALGVPLPSGRNHYRAVSTQQPPPRIFCNAQNELVYSVPGDSRDDLILLVKTANQQDQVVARIGNASIGLPSPPWSTSAPNQADGNYLAPVSATFYCLSEGSETSE